MAKTASNLIEVNCPCCHATLRIDPKLKAVIDHKEPERPKTFESMEAAVQKLKGEEARRAELFDKSFQDHKGHKQVLERKFEELFKKAKESPDEAPPKRDFDFD